MRPYLLTGIIVLTAMGAVRPAQAATPVISNVSSPNLFVGDTRYFTIRGTDLNEVATVTLNCGSSPQTVTTFTFQNANQISFYFTPPNVLGTHSITVTGSGFSPVTKPNAFEIHPLNKKPAITGFSTTPSPPQAGQSFTITVTGENLLLSGDLFLMKGSQHLGFYNAQSGKTDMTATYGIHAQPDGTYDFRFEYIDGVHPFTVGDGTPTTIDSVSPLSWNRDEAKQVFVYGTKMLEPDEIKLVGPATHSLSLSGKTSTQVWCTVPANTLPVGVYAVELYKTNILLATASQYIAILPAGGNQVQVISAVPASGAKPNDPLTFNGSGFGSVARASCMDGGTTLDFTIQPGSTATTLNLIVPGGVPVGTTTLYFYNGSNALIGTAQYTFFDGHILVGMRGDPTKDPDVRGILNAQTASAERYYRIQSGNMHARLARLRSGGDRDSRRNDFAFSVALPQSSRNQPRSRDAGETAHAAPGSIDIAGVARASSPDALACLAPQRETRWSFWSIGSVSLGSLDEKGEVQLDHTTFGLTLGADHAVGDRLIAGFALGYSHDKTDVGNRGSEVDGDGYTAALYASYSISPRVFLEGTIGYTGLSLDTRRATRLHLHGVAETGMVQGDRDGSQYFASLGVGYDCRLAGVLLSPFARFETAQTRLDGYRESGNVMALIYDAQNIEMYTGSLGLNVSATRQFRAWRLTPSAGVEYAYNFKDESRVALGYADTGRKPYSFSATSVARHTVTATAGIEAQLNRWLSLGLRYRGSFASRRDNHHFAIQAVLDW